MLGVCTADRHEVFAARGAHAPAHTSQRTTLAPPHTPHATAVFFCKILRSDSMVFTGILLPNGAKTKLSWLRHSFSSSAAEAAAERTLRCVTTTRATPMLTELTTMVAAPSPNMVAPDATSARPSVALAIAALGTLAAAATASATTALRNMGEIYGGSNVSGQ
jgi:hypothetical protein